MIIAALMILAFSGVGTGWARADSDALWRIVHDQCVPQQQDHGDPAPCELVDLTGGEDNGYAVLKDLKGARQFLLIPTKRVTGIESEVIVSPGAINYFAAAWRARYFVDAWVGYRLPRDWLSLAINSDLGRSQDQLHIHIDCLRADVHHTLALHAAQIGSSWAPFPVLLAGQPYSAIRVAGDELEAVNPFVLLATGPQGAGADMGRWTLVVVGSVSADGQPGFVILAGRADPAAGDRGAGEQLQDHTYCPPPTPDAVLTK